MVPLEDEVIKRMIDDAGEEGLEVGTEMHEAIEGYYEKHAPEIEDLDDEDENDKPVQQTSETATEVAPEIPEYYQYLRIHNDGIPGHETSYQIRTNSDEGQAYEKFSTDKERLGFMRLHAHDKMEGEHPTRFWEDKKTKKIYCINVGSPENAVITTMMEEDIDDEPEPGSEAYRVMTRDYVENAHEVEDLYPGDDGDGGNSKG